MLTKKSIKLKPHQLIKTSSIFIKQCHHIVSSVEKIQEVKNKKRKKKHGNKKTKNGRITPLSNCAVCDSKKSKLMKEWEASRL